MERRDRANSLSKQASLAAESAMSPQAAKASAARAGVAYTMAARTAAATAVFMFAPWASAEDVHEQELIQKITSVDGQLMTLFHPTANRCLPMIRQRFPDT